MQSAALKTVFARPKGRAEVWRERVFEIVLNGTWFTGVFDRVVVEQDPAGRAVRAWIIDFKTDRTGSGADPAVRAVEKHAGQMNVYRRVAAVLTGLPPGSVRCTLVLTAETRAVDVPMTE